MSGRGPNRTRRGKPRRSAPRTVDVQPLPPAPSVHSPDIIESFMSFTPTTLVTRIWGTAFLEWQDRQAKAGKAASARSARSLLETGAQGQCIGTIGEPTRDTQCYICGFKLGPEDGLTPECEHVLAIAQALLLYNLYRSGDKKNDEFLKKEYRWAHQLCNQEKAADNIIRYDSATKRFSADPNQIGKLLDKISTSGRPGKDVMEGNIGSNISEWKKNRTNAIVKDISPLVDYLNTQLGDAGQGMIALTGIANVFHHIRVELSGEIPTDPAPAPAPAPLQIPLRLFTPKSPPFPDFIRKNKTSEEMQEQRRGAMALSRLGSPLSRTLRRIGGGCLPKLL